MQIITAVQSSLRCLEMVVLRQDRFMDGFLHLDSCRRRVRGAHQVGADLYLSSAFRSCDLGAFIDPSVRLQTARWGWVGLNDGGRRLCTEGFLKRWRNLKIIYRDGSTLITSYNKHFSRIHFFFLRALKHKELR